MRHLIKSLLVLLVLGIPASGYAQTLGTIAGVAKDAHEYGATYEHSHGNRHPLKNISANCAGAAFLRLRHHGRFSNVNDRATPNRTSAQLYVGVSDAS